MPNDSAPEVYENVSVDELMKAVLNSYLDNDDLKYSGILADPMQSSLYRIGQNFQKWTPTEEQLFAIVEASPLLSLIHVHRQTQITQLSSWQDNHDNLGWAIVHKNEGTKTKQIPEDAENKINALRTILEEPYHLAIVGNTFSSFANQTVDFDLTVDKIPIELLRAGKKLRSLVLYDPRTIRPVWEILWLYRQNNKNPFIEGLNDVQLLEHMSDQYKEQTGGADLTRCSWVQYYQNQLTAAWTDDEMIVGMNFPSARIDRRGFGVSRAERSILALESWINAWGYNTEQFKIGISMTKGILAAIGSYGDENVKSLKKNLVAQLTKRPGTTFPIISIPSRDGLQWIRLDPNNSDMDFMQWLDYCSSMVCGIYSVDPQEIGLASRALAFSGKLISSSKADELIAKKDHGYKGLLLSLKHLFDRIIKKAGDDFVDYRFIWTGVDKTATERDRIATLMSKNFLTINEKRVQENEEPVDVTIPIWDSEINLADVPERLVDPLLQLVQQVQQARIQEQLMQQQMSGDVEDGEEEGKEKDQDGNKGVKIGEEKQEEEKQKPTESEEGEKRDEQEEEQVEKAVVNGRFPKTIRLTIRSDRE